MNPHPWGQGGPGFDHWGGPPPFVFPFLGVVMCLLFLLLIGTLAFLVIKKGRFGPPPWVGGAGRVNPFSPEYEARRTLATRFAEGEISSEEFLERASALNWTPGVDPKPDGKGNGKGKK